MRKSKKRLIIGSIAILSVILVSTVAFWLKGLYATLIELDVEGLIQPEWHITESTYEGLTFNEIHFFEDGTGRLVNDDGYEEMRWHFLGRRGGDQLVLTSSNNEEQTFNVSRGLREHERDLFLTSPPDADQEIQLTIGGYFTPTFNLIDDFSHNILEQGRYRLILEGLQTTLIIVFATSIIGALIGVVICSCRMSKNVLLSSIAKVMIYFFRSLPVLLLLNLSFFVVFAGGRVSPLTATIVAFSLYHAACASEVFRSGMLSIEKGQIEAATAMGFTKRQSFFYIIVPQAVRVIFPVYKGEMIRQTSVSSVVGFIGVRDLMRSLDIIRSATFNAFYPLFTAVVLYFAIIGLFTLILNLIEKLVSPRKV